MTVGPASRPFYIVRDELPELDQARVGFVALVRMMEQIRADQAEILERVSGLEDRVTRLRFNGG